MTPTFSSFSKKGEIPVQVKRKGKIYIKKKINHKQQFYKKRQTTNQDEARQC